MLNLFRQIVIYLAPVLPRLAEQTAALLNAPITQLGRSQSAAGRARRSAISAPDAARGPEEARGHDRSQHRRSRATPHRRRAPHAASSPRDDGAALAAEPLAPECTIDDFAKVDLRVARVVAAEDVPEAKKL